MGRQDSIYSEIASLEAKICEYQDYITDINNNINILTPKFDYYCTTVIPSIKEYDVTSSDFLRGNETLSVISQMETCTNASDSFSETIDSHINDLQEVIQVLEEMISECRSEIDRLYEELNSISESEVGQQIL